MPFARYINPETCPFRDILLTLLTDLPFTHHVDPEAALITGCSEPNGFGACVALELARKGYRVFASARNIKSMKAMEGVCELIELDVTSLDSVRAAHKHISEATGGRLSVLVNNAGVIGDSPILDTDLDQFRALYDINVFGQVAMIKTFGPLLVETANLVGGRRTIIVNVCSFTIHGVPWYSAYISSKAAFSALSDSIRVEMKNLGVKVINLELGAIYTQMYQNLKGFPMRSSEPSPYYPNYAAIDKKVRDDVANATPPSTAAYVAEKLVRQIDRANPPGKLWIGTFATPVAMVFGLLELFGLIALKDWIWGKAMHCNMTLKPEKRVK